MLFVKICFILIIRIKLVASLISTLIDGVHHGPAIFQEKIKIARVQRFTRTLINGIRTWKIDHGLIGRIAALGEKKISPNSFVAVGSAKGDFFFYPIFGTVICGFNDSLQISLIISVHLLVDIENFLVDRFLLHKITIGRFKGLLESR